jgi:glycosyltransferase involved in cell wall biosynthesis
VIAAWTASLAARMTGATFVYHLQDIHPEVSGISGGALGRGLPARILRWLDNQTLRRAAMIVTLSEDMVQTLQARGLGPLPIHVVNNFALDDFGADADMPPPDLRKAPGRRRVIFAGNLGHFQDLPLLIEGVALALSRHPDLELMLLGEGVATADLKRRWAEHPQVTFGPFLPYPQARELIREADIGLLSLRKDIYRVAYPSKLLTYLSLGLPVLALIEPESELARLLHEAGLGNVPAARTPEEIGEALDRLLANPIAPAHIAHWYAAHADSDAVIAQWTALFGKLGDARARR